jgi:hypothetical protein
MAAPTMTPSHVSTPTRLSAAVISTTATAPKVICQKVDNSEAHVATRDAVARRFASCHVV